MRRNETAVLILADLTSEESKGSLAKGLELMAASCEFAAQRRVVIMHTGIDNTNNPARRRLATRTHRRQSRRLGGDEGGAPTDAQTLVPTNETAAGKNSPEVFRLWLWKIAQLDTARYPPRLEVLDVTEAFNYKFKGSTTRRRASEREPVSGRGRRGGSRSASGDAGTSDRASARDTTPATGPRALAVKPARRRPKNTRTVVYKRMW